MLEIRPIVVNDQMIVLGGNMRLKACKEAGLKKVPVIKASQLTEDQQKEFIIKDNVGFGEWDWDLIANEWDTDQVTEWGLDIPDFAVQKEGIEDDYEIPDEIETDIVLGDLFEIGQHRLLCADSTDTKSYERLIKGNIIDATITDPPYGVGVKYNSFEDSKENAGKLIALFMPIIKAYEPIALTPGIPSMWFYPQPSWLMVWVHPAPSGSCPWGFAGTNPILVYGKDPYLADGLGRRPDSISMASDRQGTDGHPTPKPIKVWGWLVERLTTKMGQTILDPFLGSGTTMVAAHQLNRKCYGIEIDPKYCQVIIDRMLKLDPDLEIIKNGIKTEQYAV